MTPLLTLGLVSDVHYGPAVIGDRDCPGALARLRAALAALAAAGAEGVLNLGDAIDDGASPAADLARCAAVRQACAAVAGPVRHVVGNHDVAALSKGEFLAALGAAPTPCYGFDAGPVRVLVLDGNVHEDGTDFCRGDFSWDEAWIGAAQQRWLAEALRAAAGRPTLICCHECLDDATWHGDPDPHVVRDAPAVRRLLRDAGTVRAVLQGHYHPGRDTVIDGIPYLAVPALATGPHARLLRVGAEGVEMTAL